MLIKIANWDEHFSIQSIINIILSKLTMNPLIFILSGIIQHLLIDNIIDERPINVFNKSYKDYTSLILAILGVCIAFNSNTPLVYKLGLYGAITPDILEGLRLLLSKNAKNLWMKGNYERFHVNLGFNLIDTKNNFKGDMIRRIILLIVVYAVIKLGGC